MMEWQGLWYTTHKDVYEPSDDTFLLAQAVARRVGPGDRFLEVGCGAGLVSIAAAKGGAHVVATDVNPEAARLCRYNAQENGVSVEAVVADLMAGLDAPFEVVAFNPPYLPTEPEDKVEGVLNLAFDGGESGNDVVLRFCEQLTELPALPREVLVIHSSLSDPRPLIEAMAGLGFAHDVEAEEAHFFERLTVRRFYR